jgi:hypothetical protein
VRERLINSAIVKDRESAQRRERARERESWKEREIVREREREIEREESRTNFPKKKTDR